MSSFLTDDRSPASLLPAEILHLIGQLCVEPYGVIFSESFMTRTIPPLTNVALASRELNRGVSTALRTQFDGRIILYGKLTRELNDFFTARDHEWLLLRATELSIELPQEREAISEAGLQYLPNVVAFDLSFASGHDCYQYDLFLILHHFGSKWRSHESYRRARNLHYYGMKEVARAIGSRRRARVTVSMAQDDVPVATLRVSTPDPVAESLGRIAWQPLPGAEYSFNMINGRTNIEAYW